MAPAQPKPKSVTKRTQVLRDLRVLLSQSSKKEAGLLQQQVEDIFKKRTTQNTTATFPASSLQCDASSDDASTWTVYEKNDTKVPVLDKIDQMISSSEEIKAYATKLQSEADKLMTDSKSLDATKLLDLVKTTSKHSSVDYWIHQVMEFINRRVTPTSLADFDYNGEMFLQQVVYSAIPALFLAFEPRLYCADESVTCAETIAQFGTSKTPLVASCRPGAAIRLTSAYYLMAMMEVKCKNNKDPNRDMYKSMVMTGLTAKLIQRVREIRLQGSENTEVDTLDIAVPFVLGKHDKAKLYVTRVIHGTLTVQWLQSIEIGSSTVEAKSMFVGRLAVVLSRLARICDAYKEEIEELSQRAESSQLQHVEGAIPPTKRRGGNLTEDEESDSEEDEESDSEEDDKESDDQDAGTTGGASRTSRKQRTVKHKCDTNRNGSPRQGGKKQKRTTSQRATRSPEEMARSIASRNGQVRQLAYPWVSIGVLDLDVDDASTVYKQAEDQHESPFFFTGVTTVEKATVPVFCKVWREGDEKTERDTIEMEIDFCRKVNAGRVPSATVLNLTAMNVSLDGHDTIYHILVTTQHREDIVSFCDLTTFAVSLIQAVLKLHSIGILHCDIKPGNALWDSDEKVVRLIDFGHAQMMDSAESYETTKGYVAPEVLKGQVHNQLSDAYSTGRTLRFFVQNATGVRADYSQAVDSVMVVVKALTRQTLTSRMSLLDAETALLAHKTGSSRLLEQSTGTAGKIDSDTLLLHGSVTVEPNTLTLAL